MARDSLKGKVVFIFVSMVAVMAMFLYAIHNVPDESKTSALREIDPDSLDLMKYYMNVTKPTTDIDGQNANNTVQVDFSVTDIYIRVENNFLQGFYYNSAEEMFYESAGLYRHSHVQRLQ